MISGAIICNASGEDGSRRPCEGYTDYPDLSSCRCGYVLDERGALTWLVHAYMELPVLQQLGGWKSLRAIPSYKKIRKLTVDRR